jgi:hypothetical protein
MCLSPFPRSTPSRTRSEASLLTHPSFRRRSRSARSASWSPPPLAHNRRAGVPAVLPSGPHTGSTFRLVGNPRANRSRASSRNNLGGILKWLVRTGVARAILRCRVGWPRAGVWGRRAGTGGCRDRGRCVTWDGLGVDAPVHLKRPVVAAGGHLPWCAGTFREEQVVEALRWGRMPTPNPAGTVPGDGESRGRTASPWAAGFGQPEHARHSDRCEHHFGLRVQESRHRRAASIATRVGWRTRSWPRAEIESESRA